MSPAYNLNEFKEEIIDGKVYYMSPSANPRHGRIIGNIYFIFKSYLKGKTCEVFTDTIDIFLNEEGTDKVIPDVSVLCDPDKFTDKGYHGVPSLIVEVISPTSIKRDRETKFHKYEAYGAKEYWIVDPLNKSIEQFILHEGKYRLEGVYTQLDEADKGRLYEEQEVVKQFKTSIFSELTIDVDDIF